MKDQERTKAVVHTCMHVYSQEPGELIKIVKMISNILVLFRICVSFSLEPEEYRKPQIKLTLKKQKKNIFAKLTQFFLGGGGA